MSLAAMVLLWGAFAFSRPFPVWGVDFEWSEAGGFSRIEVNCPPSPHSISGVGSAYCGLIAVQAKRFITREFRKYRWNRANGSLAVITLNPFPIVLGLSRTSNWKIVDPAITPLMQASEEGDLIRVRELIEGGANVNDRDQRGYTPLIHACIGNHDSPEIIRHLLSAGAELDVKDNSGRNALLWSLFDISKPLAVAELVAAGADVNVKDQWGNSALHNAVVAGPDENTALRAVKILLSGGADVSAENAKGQTAMAIAEATGRSKIAELLGQSGTALR